MFKTYSIPKGTNLEKVSEQAKAIFLEAVADAYYRYICINEFEADDVEMSKDEAIVLTYEEGTLSDFLGVGQEADASPVILSKTTNLARITYEDIAEDMMFSLGDIGCAEEDCWAFAETACERWHSNIEVTLEMIDNDREHTWYATNDGFTKFIGTFPNKAEAEGWTKIYAPSFQHCLFYKD